MNTLIFLICAIAIIAIYYIWPYNFWKKKGIKTLPSSPLFGNLSGVIRRKIPIYRMFQEVYETCKKSGEKFMGFYFLNTPTLVITHPELLKRVLIKDFSHFTDRQFYLNENDPLTINLASVKGHQWKKTRDQLSPAFSPSKLKLVFQILLQVGDQLKSALDKTAEDHEVVNLKDVISKYIVDAIGMGIFGIDCNTLQGSNMEFKRYAENTFGGSFSQHIKLMLSVLCPSVLLWFRIPFISYDIQTFFLDMIKSTVEHREKNNIVRNDLMHFIIQLRNNINIEEEDNSKLGNASENEKSLKIEEITAQALLFFGAAYETTASTISLCMYELVANKDVQNNLREEITSVLEKNTGKLNYDAVMEMPYLDKCVSETLRKYGVAGMTSRICTKKYQLPDTDIVIDVGTMVYIPIYELQHDPEYYPNPDKYDPERFSPENKAMRPSCTYLAFGDGGRHCIGFRLGLLEVKIFLVTFLSNYNFTVNSKVKLPPAISKSNLIVSLENPLYINIEKI